MRCGYLLLLVLASSRLAAGPAEPPPAACLSVEHRALDFWLGRWRVETATGVQAGASRVEKTLSGCALLEHWNGIFLKTGKVQQGLGVHRYDAATRQWRQAWVDDTGFTSDTIGALHGDRLVYDETGADGVRSRVRLMPLPDGRVEQLGERWNQALQSWQTTFHLIYHPET